MAVNPCLLTNILAQDYLQALRFINRKYAALRRLAQLLEQLGDLSPALAILSALGGLVPIINIDARSYALLVEACPFLNLPKLPKVSDVSALQKLVADAYKKLAAQLANSPWQRMGALQTQLDKAHNKVLGILAEGGQYVKCLQAACAATATAVSFVNNFSFAGVDDQASAYANNFVRGGGQVLNNQMATKYGQVQVAITSLNELASPAPITPEPPNQPIASLPSQAPQIPLPPPKR